MSTQPGAASQGTHRDRRRLAAIAALLIILAVVIGTLVRLVDDPLRVIAELLLLAVIVGAGWIALTRAGTRRVIATVVAGVAVVALIVSLVNAEGSLGISMAVRIAALVAAVALAKYALGNTARGAEAERDAGHAGAGGRRGVLFMNLKSGGGKAERFHLVDECKRRGIEPVVLEPGMDWLQTVRDVAASGEVDVLGMAGGDGSQAMVGTVAAEFGLPMVVVPAGPATTWPWTSASTARTSSARSTRTARPSNERWTWPT